MPETSNVVRQSIAGLIPRKVLENLWKIGENVDKFFPQNYDHPVTHPENS